MSHRNWLWFLLPFTLLLAAPALAVTDVELTPLQVAAGFVTWLNFVRVLVVAIGVVCVAILARHWILYLISIFGMMPKQVWEAVGHLVAIALIYQAHTVAGDTQFWMLFGGALLWGAMIVISASLHSETENFSGLCVILALIWAVTALLFSPAGQLPSDGAEAVGLLAVLAFMGAVGFSAVIIPGFEKGATPRATATAVLLTLLASGWHLSGLRLANPFETGALWVGPIVAAIGFLIMASRYYSSKASYPVRQILPLAGGLASTFAGTTYGIPHLAGIGGTFFVLYLIGKASDIPAKSVVQYAYVGLAVSILLGGGVWWAQDHMDVVRPFLLF